MDYVNSYSIRPCDGLAPTKLSSGEATVGSPKRLIPTRRPNNHGCEQRPSRRHSRPPPSPVLPRADEGGVVDTPVIPSTFCRPFPVRRRKGKRTPAVVQGQIIPQRDNPSHLPTYDTIWPYCRHARGGAFVCLGSTDDRSSQRGHTRTRFHHPTPPAEALLRRARVPKLLEERRRQWRW